MSIKLKIHFFFLLLAAISLIADANEKVVGDIDCDGKADTAIIIQSKKNVTLSVSLQSGVKANELIFGLGEPMFQDSLCGNKASLNPDILDDLTEMFDANPEGYKPSKTCIGLNLSGGECDSFHIFWNHKSKELNWWRL